MSFSLSIGTYSVLFSLIFWEDKLSKIMQKVNNNLHFYSILSFVKILLHFVVGSKHSFNGVEKALCSRMLNEETEAQKDRMT